MPDVLPVIEVPDGRVPGEVVRQIAGAFGTQAVLALCDWQSGALATETCQAYRPPAWLERLVTTRDGTCRFFGCTVPAAAATSTTSGHGRTARPTRPT